MVWIRKKRKRSGLLAYKQSAPVGIGRSIEDKDADEHAHRVKVITENRVAVFLRDWRGCRCCNARPLVSDHCHEHESRAMLRGRQPEEIFNLWNCIRLCAACHRRITEHEIDLVMVDPVAGCSGEVLFVPHVSKWGR